MLYGHITELIGDTPLLRLDPARHGLAGVELYAKLESANPFGSVKDRVAAAMVAGVLDEMRAGGRTVVEASSGNTAKALGVIAAMAGITVRAYTNRVRVAEMRDLLMLLEVDVHELPGLSECPDPTAPNDVFGAIAELLERSPGRYVHTSQYTSEVNIEAHYQGTGREIFDDIGQVDILVGGLGTTGSTRGAATFLREKNPELRTVGVVSTPADFIPGIRSAAEMWEVGLFQPDFYDAVVPVESAAAIDASLELALRHGILAGPTGGASYAAVKAFLAEQDVAERPLAVVFIVCDRLESYLSYYRQRRPELFGRAARTRAADLPDAEVAAAPAVGPAALAAALDTDLVVDLRGGLAYRFGHVPGSVNIREDQLDQMLADGIPFPARKRVVFVCPVGELSARYAALLRRADRPAASLAGGITAWRDAGHPLER